ncbi:MAG: GGDEF domain-containing protein [Lachnospiraceae bacterium]|nr:GGDEF domain-containing protein [Lachnospiraceae bacterium]
MNDLNITAYQNEEGEIAMHYGFVSIRNGYYFVNANENFYEMIGSNVCYSILEVLHPDDLECFGKAVGLMDKCPQHIIGRLRCYNNKYRWFYMILKYNGKLIEGFRSFDIELSEIMTIADKFLEYKWNVDKYRKFMSLYPGLFFEYEFRTGIFKIYQYLDGRAQLLLDESLEKIYERVQQNEDFTFAQRSDFQILYESLLNGRDHFKTTVDAVTLMKGHEDIRYEFRFSTMYKDSKKEMVVGLITVVSEKQPKKSYYMSENAFDPGTGLLNKRAINEYAIDKIQNRTPGVYLIIMDVDDFKKINDTYGHMYGDEVLSQVAEIISSVLKGRGMAGRFGGDEFMVVLEGVETETELRRIISTINKHINWTFNIDAGTMVTTSIGISKFPEDGTTYDELFLKADKCLYIAKAKGKNRYIIYNEEKHGAVVKEDNAGREVGLKATISEEEKTMIVSEMVLKLHKEGKDALDEVMKDMQSYFDIDGVALYKGSDMKRVLSRGKYVNPIQSLSFVGEAGYLEFVDEQGFYMENKMQRLENKSALAYQMYKDQETAKVIQYILLEDKKPIAAVSFDFFNRAPKYGTTDMGLMRIVGRLMAETLAGSDIV